MIKNKLVPITDVHLKLSNQRCWMLRGTGRDMGMNEGKGKPQKKTAVILKMNTHSQISRTGPKILVFICGVLKQIPPVKGNTLS